LDFKDADVLAKRLRKTLPPGLVPPSPGEPPAPEQPPSPEMIAAQSKMASEKSRAELAQMKVEQEKIKLENEKIKLQIEQAKAQAELAILQMPKQEDNSYMFDQQERQANLILERERLDLEKARFAHTSGMDMTKQRQEEAKIILDNIPRFGNPQ